VSDLFLFSMLLCVGGATIILLRRVDSVIRTIYTTDKIRWQELGRPTGFFWRPKEKVSFFQSVGARNAIIISAVFAPKALSHSDQNKTSDEIH
jgi:hypothetical protein